jgi:hypothetical protein
VFYYNVSGTNDCVLESLIPVSIIDNFKNNLMTPEARDYWNSTQSRMESQIVTGSKSPPKGWDKNSLKNKLCEYYTNNYSTESDFEHFIKFYTVISD